MENTSYIALSRQIVLQRLMNVTANNMANMTTPGFKSQNMLFEEYLTKDQDSGEKLSQVQDISTYRDLSQGALTHTDNQLDLAVQGDGYFAVQTPSGIRYTRDGSFSVNNKGELVTKSGYLVMSDNNSALTIPPGAAHITITEAGDISTEKGSAGKLKVVTFNNPQILTPTGDNLFTSNDGQEQKVEKPHVMQGMVENSNVQPILEMNKMIEILRLYQGVQNLMLTEHERQRNTIQRLTRI